jgi:hypothetical protein
MKPPSITIDETTLDQAGDLLGLYLATLGLWIILRKTPLLHHAWEKWIYKKPSIQPDFEDWLLIRSSFFYTLWMCKWCQGFWLSVVFALVAGDHGVLATVWWFLVVYPLFMFSIITLWKE